MATEEQIGRALLFLSSYYGLSAERLEEDDAQVVLALMGDLQTVERGDLSSVALRRIRGEVAAVEVDLDRLILEYAFNISGPGGRGRTSRLTILATQANAGEIPELVHSSLQSPDTLERRFATLIGQLARSLLHPPRREELSSDDEQALDSVPHHIAISGNGWRERILPLLIARGPSYELTRLSWSDMGRVIETLAKQIRNYGSRLDVDLVVGVNEAGLTIASFLSSYAFGRARIGYIRTETSLAGEAEIIIDATILPGELDKVRCVLLCDFEVKTSQVLRAVTTFLHESGVPRDGGIMVAAGGLLAVDGPELPPNLPVAVQDLVCHDVLVRADISELFAGCIMARPGIEPPLDLR